MKEEFNLYDNYDPFADPVQIAEDNGWELVLPQPNQLFIDIDSEEAYQEFLKRYHAFSQYRYNTWEVQTVTKISKSGFPNRHIYITFKDRTFTDLERLALQAALGDDPVRVFLSGIRIENNFSPAITFFEKP